MVRDDIEKCGGKWGENWESSEFTTSLPLQWLARECNLQDMLASEHDDLHQWYVPASGVMWGWGVGGCGQRRVSGCGWWNSDSGGIYWTSHIKVRQFQPVNGYRVFVTFDVQREELCRHVQDFVGSIIRLLANCWLLYQSIGHGMVSHCPGVLCDQ